MFEFSTTAILDGLIHLGAFLLKSIGLYMMLKLIARDKFETNFFRTVFLVGSIVIVTAYLEKYGWASNIVGVMAILFVLAFILHPLLLKTQLLVSCISSLVLVGLSLGLDHVAIAFSDKVVPEGPTFAEYMGLAQEAIEENKSKEGLKSTDVGLVDIMRKGLDSLATLTEEEQMEAMKTDFNRGMVLFAERKAWMDSLTPEEKRMYKEEMAAFLAEQGIATHHYSLAAIKEVNPTNLVALAGLFSELQDDDIEEEVRIRSIPESLTILAANFSGTELGEQELGLLQQFAELFARDEIEEAMAKAQMELEEAEGNNKLAGAVLAALVQAESGLPADQLFSGEEGASLLNADALKNLAVKHWKSKGLDPTVQWKDGSGVDTGKAEVCEVQVLEIEPEPEAVPQPDPFIRITTPLGIAIVPSDPLLVSEWIAAAHMLQMKGFVSLGNELVILRNDGEMLRNGDLWSVEHVGQAFSFRIDTIAKGKVVLTGEYRESVAAE